MKLSKSLLSLMMVSTMVVGSVSFAVTDTAVLQQLSSQQIAAQAAHINEETQKYNKLATALSAAEVKGAGYSVKLSEGGKYSLLGLLLASAGGGGRAYQEVASQRTRFVTKGKPVTAIIAGLGVLGMASGYFMRQAASESLEISQREADSLRLQMTQAEINLATQRSIMMEQAKKLGATVTENIETKQVVVSGLDGLQTIVGSGLVPLQTIPMFQAPATR